MRHHYLPFANSANDWQLVSSLYPEPAGCRITLQSVLQSSGASSENQRRPTCKLWVDCGVDGLHFKRIRDPHDDTNRKYRAYIGRFPRYDLVADPTFQQQPSRNELKEFVRAILDTAFQAVPEANWLSVPQLPYTEGRQRSKINKLMAEITAEWRSAARYKGKLILPIILATASQANLKSVRRPKVDLASACFEASNADGVWVADSTLNDQDGARNFESTRFPDLINFHEELNSALARGSPAEPVSVAGPYWAINIVLWARGLVKIPAVGLGKSFQYHIAGGRLMNPRVRIALPPLKRLAVYTTDLRTWIEEVARILPKADGAHAEFAGLLRNIQHLHRDDAARRQVARFHRGWMDKLESVPPAGRALALYQDFSSAYVLGMKLNKALPEPEEVRDPARIARQFMVNCL